MRATGELVLNIWKVQLTTGACWVLFESQPWDGILPIGHLLGTNTWERGGRGIRQKVKTNCHADLAKPQPNPQGALGHAAPTSLVPLWAEMARGLHPCMMS